MIAVYVLTSDLITAAVVARAIVASKENFDRVLGSSRSNECDDCKDGECANDLHLKRKV